MNNPTWTLGNLIDAGLSQRVPIYPIFCLTQHGYEIYHEDDPVVRISIQPQPQVTNDFNTLYSLYTLLVTIGNLLVQNSAIKLNELQSGDKYDKGDIKGFVECCGFSSIIIACTLILCIITLDKLNQPINYENIIKLLQTDYQLQLTECAFNMDSLYYKLVVYFRMISGYYGMPGIGWNEKCPNNSTEIEEGVNLVTLYSNKSKSGGCTTTHHFVVIVNEGYCLIYDTWAGGIHGIRPAWTRIMQTAHFKKVLNLLDNEYSVPDVRTEILKQYFAAPSNNNYIYTNRSNIGLYTEYDLIELMNEFTCDNPPIDRLEIKQLKKIPLPPTFPPMFKKKHQFRQPQELSMQQERQRQREERHELRKQEQMQQEQMQQMQQEQMQQEQMQQEQMQPLTMQQLQTQQLQQMPPLTMQQLSEYMNYTDEIQDYNIFEKMYDDFNYGNTDMPGGRHIYKSKKNIKKYIKKNKSKKYIKKNKSKKYIKKNIKQ